MRKTIDGNQAVARIAYALSEVATIYPITPSSEMSELSDKWSGLGEQNLFGNTVQVVEMQSEAGSSAAMHGALSAGALATTFTSSQGLLLMIPNMYKIAGELLSNVIHVSARAISTHALSIFGDHSDVMATRQIGYSMLCSNSVQEAQDFALVSHLATLKSSVPFLHFFDGFRTSHELNTIDLLDTEKIKEIYPYEKLTEFKSRGLNSSHPHQQGTAQNPDIFFQNKEASNVFYNNVPLIVKDVMNDVYKITGRQYDLFEYSGSASAKEIIIVMGSAATTAESTIEFLNNQGNNYGILKVRLFRPFSIKDFVSKIPNTVEKIAVLDRTKEPGSAGEPLYQDVINALYESNKTNIKVYGGRFGIGSKDFTPTMVKAVFDNLKQPTPKNHFTIGIIDDVTHTSLPLPEKLITCEKRMTSCKFYGYGGDGTVSANKSSIKIISENTELYGQAYFEYDSKKTGNSTITHMRFGKNPINECYLLNNIEFIACHNQTYLTKYNLLKDVKHGGIFLLNTSYSLEQLEKIMPNRLKHDIAKNKIKFYKIDAYKIALNLGLKAKINLIMQTAFFKLMNLMPLEKAKEEIKKYAKSAYTKSGEEMLERNYKAIDAAEKEIELINYPSSWAELTEKDLGESLTSKTIPQNQYYEEFIKPIQRLEGDDIPVSKFDPRGFVPTGTSKFEKRGVATQLPCWISENCIQCNLCSFVCPHAAIRPYLINPDNLENKPDNLITLPAMGEPDKQFIIQLNPLDCTGCSVCANVCPAKNKALVMKENTEIMESEIEKYNFVYNSPKEKSSIFAPATVKGLGFKDPYFEFSGACAGCGETPYIKVLTQLFGDRMIMANATGCSSIYGGSSPACPYTTDENGNGVAWASSLFEDNAEFGLGIKLGTDTKQNKLKQLLTEFVKENQQNNISHNESLNDLINNYLNEHSPEKQKELSKTLINNFEKINKTGSNKIVNEILDLKDAFITQRVWIMGGDGWAYDIGYGGLDHVLASKQNVNILVLDTEVYSNTGGQASKATPLGAIAKFASVGKRSRKKDLALLATMYKDVYVAKISMGANYSHVVKTFMEAEKYNGVSIIIAYSPCIAHGIDLSKSQESMKLAVESGYWHLWRYNPELKLLNKNPFVLDSQKPSKPLKDFLLTENRYRNLIAKDEEIASELFELAQKEADETYLLYKKLSEETV